ncbi:MAG: hypothetical protein ABIT10_02015 [Alteraurantiacibacter sp.]
MRRASPLILAAGLFGWSALAQSPAVYDDAAETRTALQQALAGRQAAAARSEVLEEQARVTQDEAEKTARQAAALAARIQQAEAGIAAAEARKVLVTREQVRLAAQLGREQQPIVSLTAALQQFSRRPVALSLLRPGAIRDLVYLRAVMAEAVPQVQRRTASLRRRIDRSQQLALAARQAGEVLVAEQASLSQRRSSLAAIEARQRLAALAAGSVASREAERTPIARRSNLLRECIDSFFRTFDVVKMNTASTAVIIGNKRHLPFPLLQPSLERHLFFGRIG